MKKIKSIKVWGAIYKETGELFSTNTRSNITGRRFNEICLHPTKKDALKAGYGKEYWELIQFLITPQ